MPNYNPLSLLTNNSYSLHSTLKMLSSIGFLATGITLATSVNALPNGKPFQEIAEALENINSQINAANENIDTLSAQIDDINNVINNQILNNTPVSADVDCNAGETVTAVTDAYANSTAQLTINISGVCNEPVFILRDNVQLIGVTPGASINSTTPYYGAVTVSRGAKNARIDSLTLYGPAYGLLATKSSQTVATDVTVSAGLYAVLSLDNAVLEITDSNIQNSQIGLLVSRNGVASISASTISNNNTGALASIGGMINVYTTAPDGLPTSPVIVDGNYIGFNATMTGKLSVTAANVFNGSFGVVLSSTGFAQINSSSFSNLSLAGVSVQKAASVFFNTSNYFANNASGISCVPGSNYLVSAPLGTLPGTFVNNGIDNNSCTP